MGEEQNFQLAMAQLQHRYNMEYEMVRAIAAFEHAAIKPLFLLNGGAAAGFAGLFAVLRDDPESARFLLVAVVVWIGGLLFAFLATSFAAFSQFNFRKYRGIQGSAQERAMGLDIERDDWGHAKGWSDNANTYRREAIFAGIGSIACFMLGLIPAVLAVL